MADRRTAGGRRLITTRRLAAAVLVTAASLGVAGVAAPPVDTVDLPATATETADRITPPGPSIGGCPIFPGDNAWNTDISGYPLHPRSSADHRPDPVGRRRQPAPRLRREPRLRHPVRRGPARSAAGADHLHRVRRRERPGAVPDPARRPGRRRRAERRRPPRAGAAAGHVRAVRVVRGAAAAATAGPPTSGARST